MGASVKFNGGNTLLVYDGAGSATLESLGLATAGEVARLKADLATAANVTKQLAEELAAARQVIERNGQVVIHASAAELAAEREIQAALQESLAKEVARLTADLATAANVTKQLAEERTALRVLGHKVNAIRNSIIGMQGFNFSEHAYPLVAALDAAGFEGEAYLDARGNLGTLIEQRDDALAELAAEREIQAALQESLAKEVTAHLETTRERDESLGAERRKDGDMDRCAAERLEMEKSERVLKLQLDLMSRECATQEGCRQAAESERDALKAKEKQMLDQINKLLLHYSGDIPRWALVRDFSPAGLAIAEFDAKRAALSAPPPEPKSTGTQATDWGKPFKPNPVLMAVAEKAWDLGFCSFSRGGTIEARKTRDLAALLKEKP